MAQTNNEARTDRNRAATAQQHKSVHHLPPTYQSMVRGPPVERYNTNIMKIFQAGWRKPVSVAGRTNTTCNNNSKTTMRTTYERETRSVCARALTRTQVLQCAHALERLLLSTAFGFMHFLLGCTATGFAVGRDGMGGAAALS